MHEGESARPGARTVCALVYHLPPAEPVPVPHAKYGYLCCACRSLGHTLTGTESPSNASGPVHERVWDNGTVRRGPIEAIRNQRSRRRRPPKAWASGLLFPRRACLCSVSHTDPHDFPTNARAFLARSVSFTSLLPFRSLCLSSSRILLSYFFPFSLSSLPPSVASKSSTTYSPHFFLFFHYAAPHPSLTHHLTSSFILCFSFFFFT